MAPCQNGMAGGDGRRLQHQRLAAALWPLASPRPGPGRRVMMRKRRGRHALGAAAMLVSLAGVLARSVLPWVPGLLPCILGLLRVPSSARAVICACDEPNLCSCLCAGRCIHATGSRDGCISDGAGQLPHRRLRPRRTASLRSAVECVPQRRLSCSLPLAQRHAGVIYHAMNHVHHAMNHVHHRVHHHLASRQRAAMGIGAAPCFSPLLTASHRPLPL